MKTIKPCSGFLGLIALFISFAGKCQIKQLNTGTNAYLRDLSVIDKNIFIHGNGNDFNYLVKSNDECNTLIPIAIPGPTTGYITRIQRLDTNTIFLLSYTPSQTLLYKSHDGGNNWIQKSSTSGAFSHEIAFFDSTDALMTDGPFLWRTTDGGSTWISATPDFGVGYETIKVYGDSMVCMGSIGVSSVGAFKISKDRGQTWPYGGGSLGLYPTDSYFLNQDTVLCISSGGGFNKTLNGGQSWHPSTTDFIYSAYGICFKNYKEGYVTGADNQNNGIVVKTTDLGQTWSTFNTGIKTTLLNMAILNDSIAILTGSDGVLLRWNYTNTIFTALGENYLDNAGLKIFPNPVTDKLHVEVDSQLPLDLKLSISNTLGQVVFTKNTLDVKEELDISFLPQGLYYLKAENTSGQKVFKIIKE